MVRKKNKDSHLRKDEKSRQMGDIFQKDDRPPMGSGNNKASRRPPRSWFGHLMSSPAAKLGSISLSLGSLGMALLR